MEFEGLLTIINLKKMLNSSKDFWFRNLLMISPFTKGLIGENVKPDNTSHCILLKGL